MTPKTQPGSNSQQNNLFSKPQGFFGNQSYLDFKKKQGGINFSNNKVYHKRTQSNLVGSGGNLNLNTNKPNCTNSSSNNNNNEIKGVATTKMFFQKVKKTGPKLDTATKNATTTLQLQNPQNLSSSQNSQNSNPQHQHRRTFSNNFSSTATATENTTTVEERP